MTYQGHVDALVEVPGLAQLPGGGGVRGGVVEAGVGVMDAGEGPPGRRGLVRGHGGPG